MRTREEVETDMAQPRESAHFSWIIDRLMIELLLDIRELLGKH